MEEETQEDSSFERTCALKKAPGTKKQYKQVIEKFQKYKDDHELYATVEFTDMPVVAVCQYVAMRSVWQPNEKHAARKGKVYYILILL
jgi:hypothetical protein